MEKTSFEVWLSVDDDGNAAVSLDGSTEAFTALIESNENAAAVRTVKVTVAMTLPEIAEVDVEVPDEAGTSQQVEVKAA
jgi:hypothetical protein